jgi:hypothetical protein
MVYLHKQSTIRTRHVYTTFRYYHYFYMNYPFFSYIDNYENNI